MSDTMIPQMGVAQRLAPAGEIAVTAMAAKAKALVEAKYIIAMNRPRNVDQARVDILSACKRPEFAEEARFKKSVGNKLVDGRWVPQFATGFSIRFAEHAIQSMRNISTEVMTIYDGDDKRTVNVSVTDLETNTSYGEDVTLEKTVERRKLKEGQEAISQRQNSKGEIVYLVEATEDELANKIGAAKSKIIRNNGLRLVPSDILAEAETMVEETLLKGGVDVKAGVKKVTDAFASLNISPTELEKYLGHPMATVSPKELADLRAIHTSIKEGAAAWSDYWSSEKEPAKKPVLNPVTQPVKAPEPVKQEPLASTGNPVGTTETPQSKLADFLSYHEVAFDDFRGWLISAGHYAAADSIGTIEDLPTPVAERLIKNTGALTRLSKLFGKKEVTP